MSDPGNKPWSRAARDHGPRMLRFGGVGVANTITDLALFWVLIVAGLSPVVANVAAFFGANLQSYLVNARVTFRVDGRPAAVTLPGYLKFLAAHAMSLAVSTAMVALLAHRIGPLPAKAASIGFTFAWNYAATAAFVFAKRAAHPEKTADAADDEG
jgi:putative flippase GtrA